MFLIIFLGCVSDTGNRHPIPTDRVPAASYDSSLAPKPTPKSSPNPSPNRNHNPNP